MGSVGLHFMAVEARMTCGKCGQPVILNGPLLSLPCAYCQHQVRLDPSTWHKVFEMLDLASSELGSGEAKPDAPPGTLQSIEVAYRPETPVCLDCGGALSEAWLAAKVGTANTCGSCGKTSRMWPAPEWLKESNPSAVALFGADLEAGEVEGVELELKDDLSPIAMQCPQCRGSLRLGGSMERATPCTHCGVDVFVPDALWYRLHPVRTVHTWYVGFRPASANLLELELEADELPSEPEPEPNKTAEEDGESRADVAATAEKRALNRAAARRASMLIWAFTLPALAGWSLCFADWVMTHPLASRIIRSWGIGTEPGGLLGEEPGWPLLIVLIVTLVLTLAAIATTWNEVDHVDVGHSRGMIPVGLGFSACIPVLGLVFAGLLLRGFFRSTSNPENLRAIRAEHGFDIATARRKLRVYLAPGVVLGLILVAALYVVVPFTGALRSPNLGGGDLNVSVYTVRGGNSPRQKTLMDANSNSSGDLTQSVTSDSGRTVYVTRPGSMFVDTTRKEAEATKARILIKEEPDPSFWDYATAWLAGDEIRNQSFPGNPRLADDPGQRRGD